MKTTTKTQQNTKPKAGYMRHPVYAAYDAILEMQGCCVNEAEIVKDRELSRRLDKLQAAMDDVREHMDNWYIWD